MKKLMLFCFVLLSAQRLVACECLIIQSFYYYYNSNEHVFSGKILNIKDTADTDGYHLNLILTVKIINLYKGQFSSDTLNFYTGTSSPACGLTVQTGDIWIFFATGSTISKCEPNFLVERNGKFINQFYFDTYEVLPLNRELEKILKNKSFEAIELNAGAKKTTTYGYIKNGLAEGAWCSEYNFDNGLRKEEVFYKNGLQDSVACFYKDGRLEREEWWTIGERTNNENEYFRNGKLKWERKDDGKGNSRFTKYYKDGSLLSEEISQNGETIFKITCLDGEPILDNLNYDDNEVLTRYILHGGEEEEIEIINEKGELVREKHRASKILKIEGK